MPSGCIPRPTPSSCGTTVLKETRNSGLETGDWQIGGYPSSAVAPLFMVCNTRAMKCPLPGQIENAIDGLLLGVLYLACGRNPCAPIIAHGITDTVDLMLLFLGKYPGI